MNKQPEITDATREALVTAFFRLAEKKSIYKITIREISDISGYNRSTFYRYFNDVFALLEYAENTFIDDMLKTLTNELLRKPEIDDSFFRIMLDKFRLHKERLAVLLNNQNRTQFISRLHERIVNEVINPLNKTQESNLVMTIYFNGIFSAMASHITEDNPMKDEVFIGYLRRLFENWYWPEISIFLQG